MAAQIVGGGQQMGLRAGTENLSGIAGFGAAIRTLRDGAGERARITHVRDRFESALRSAIPEVLIFGVNAPRLCGTSNFVLPDIMSPKLR